MSASDTSSLVEVEVPHHGHDDDRAADDDVDPARLQARDCGGAVRSARSRACGTPPRPPRASGGSGGCVRSRTRRHRARPRPSSTPCPRVPISVFAVAAAGSSRSTSSEMVAHDRHGLAQFLGRRRVAVAGTLGQPHTADVDGQQPVRLVGADDELGRAAADVEHEVRTGFDRVRRSRPRTSSAPSSSPRDELRPHTDRGFGRIEEVLAVARIARCARRRHAHALDAGRVDARAVLAQRGDRAFDRVRMRAVASRRHPGRGA